MQDVYLPTCTYAELVSAAATLDSVNAMDVETFMRDLTPNDTYKETWVGGVWSIAVCCVDPTYSAIFRTRSAWATFLQDVVDEVGALRGPRSFDEFDRPIVSKADVKRMNSRPEIIFWVHNLNYELMFLLAQAFHVPTSDYDMYTYGYNEDVEEEQPALMPKPLFYGNHPEIYVAEGVEPFILPGKAIVRNVKKDTVRITYRTESCDITFADSLKVLDSDLKSACKTWLNPVERERYGKTDMEHTVARNSVTPLSEEEQTYILNDVRSLVLIIRAVMSANDISKPKYMPITKSQLATRFVRKSCTYDANGVYARILRFKKQFDKSGELYLVSYFDKSIDPDFPYDTKVVPGYVHTTKKGVDKVHLLVHYAWPDSRYVSKDEGSEYICVGVVEDASEYSLLEAYFKAAKVESDERSAFSKRMNDNVMSVEEARATRESVVGGSTVLNPEFEGLEKLVQSGDYTSCYPTVLCSRKFPKGQSTPIDPNDKDLINMLLNMPKNGDYSYIMEVELSNVVMKQESAILPFTDSNWMKNPNRLSGKFSYVGNYTKFARMITNEHWEIIRDTCDLSKLQVKVLGGFYSKADYIPKRLLRAVVQACYSAKTELKDVEGAGLEYTTLKIILNTASFGKFCQNAEYETYLLTPDCGYVKGDSSEVQNDGRRTFDLRWGTHITAGAQVMMWDLVAMFPDGWDSMYSINTDAYYTVTSAAKTLKIFELWNRRMKAHWNRMTKLRKLPADYFEPKSIKGKVCMLGEIVHEHGSKRRSTAEVDAPNCKSEYITVNETMIMIAPKQYAVYNPHPDKLPDGKVKNKLTFTLAGRNKAKTREYLMLLDKSHTERGAFELFGRERAIGIPEEYSGRTRGLPIEFTTRNVITDYLGNTCEMPDTHGLVILDEATTLFHKSFQFTSTYDLSDIEWDALERHEKYRMMIAPFIDRAVEIDVLEGND